MRCRSGHPQYLFGTDERHVVALAPALQPPQHPVGVHVLQAGHFAPLVVEVYVAVAKLDLPLPQLQQDATGCRGCSSFRYEYQSA